MITYGLFRQWGFMFSLTNKRVLVTGGTGSMGKILVRRLLSGELGLPANVIVLSRDEAKQYDMRASYMNRIVGEDESVYENFQKRLQFWIGDVRDYHTICSVLKDVDVVINAAAMKQVPTCEYFPYEAIKTNCVGAYNIVQAINENKLPVEVVVGISTDKAAKPVNVMGMTKAIQERIFTSANILNKKTRFVCVRYGNVLASRGSVIPLFHKQMASGGPVTVTVPEMTRFLLSLEQAVDTVIAALKWAEPGETLIPRAPAATVMNIANALIGSKKIPVKITGIRPGEKMHEIMISEEEINHTVERNGYFVIKSMLPELNSEPLNTKVLTKEFSSGDWVLSFEDTVKLLESNKLLNIDTSREIEGELLR
jgi:FlaA1/EpsC-like NDP-sugar epimerase